MAEASVSRLLELFEAALDRAEPDRAAFLDASCGEDAELRLGVLELLGEHARAEGVLDRGAGLAGLAETEPDDDLTGREIGPFRILEPLGEGGMGVVYRAEQTAPVRRQVALKLLKLGMDTRSVVRRFEGERQALALMDHPAIASIHDGGVSAEGRPWFAMELFEGAPITAFCDERRLPVRERLALLIQVADAVEHAHRRGIIHRDLKPSNLLVRELDGRAVPKVIDFGIARIAGPGGAPRTQTAQGLRVGTPDYMSPEQASGASDIDTRTDVYALGIVLYELLVGVLPREGGGAGPAAEPAPDPPTPSARVRGLTGAEAADVAIRRRSDPGRLRQRLSGELDWIVMMAIAHERERRYGSVADLAEDLRRYLADLPVRAGPPSPAYRARKFARRHRAAVIAGSIALGAVMLGALGIGWSALAAIQARAATEAALARARYEADTTGAVTDLLFETLASADPEGRLESPTEARELKVVDVLARAGDEAGVRFAERPLLEAELRSLVGRTLLRLQQLDEAEPQLQRALELRQRLLGEDAPGTLSVRHDLASLAGSRGHHEEEAGLQRAVLEARRRTLGPDHADTLASMASLGDALVQLGRLEPAAELYREALERGTRALGEDHLVVTEALTGMAYLERLRGDSEAAVRAYARIVELRRRVQGPDHPATLTAINNLAAATQSAGRPAEAEALYRELVERHRRVLGPRDPRTLNSESNLGATLWRLGRVDEAAELFREVVAANVEILGPSHPQTLLSTNNLGRMLMDQGELGEAERVYRRLIPKAEQALPAGHVNLALYHGSYGLLLLRAERYAEAEPEILTALHGLESALGPENPRVRTQVERLVELYEGWGRDDRAAVWRARLETGD